MQIRIKISTFEYDEDLLRPSKSEVQRDENNEGQQSTSSLNFIQCMRRNLKIEKWLN